MSEEVAILAIVTPAPGKLDRFKQVSQTCFDWIQANEPQTLQFEMYEIPAGEDGQPKIAFFEKYASQSAKEQHESSDNYKTFFQNVMAEELLAGPPMLFSGPSAGGFKR